MNGPTLLDRLNFRQPAEPREIYGSAMTWLADRLASLGFSIAPQEFFDTITVEVGPYQGLIMKENLRKVGCDRIGMVLQWQGFIENRILEE
jgi:hypothetical protein